jgi:hypothetical protein
LELSVLLLIRKLIIIKFTEGKYLFCGKYLGEILTAVSK